MLMRAVIAFTLVVLLAPTLSGAQEGNDENDKYVVPHDVPKLALAIGVQNYDALPTVDNALNDLAEMASRLTELGFNVRELPDPTVHQIDLAIDELADLAGDPTKQPAVIVFFFAGHGFQDGAVNYLVAKNAPKSDDLKDYSLSVSELLRRVTPKAAGLTVVFLDACRTSTPFSDLLPPDATVARTPGFAEISTIDRVAVGFAPKWHEPALSKIDATDRDSPYTSGLSIFLQQRNLTLAQIFGHVHDYVWIRSYHKQIPEAVVSARDDVYSLNRASDSNQYRQTWTMILRTNRFDCVDSFVSTSPDSPYLQSALEWELDHPTGDRSLGGIGCPEP